MSIDTSSPFEAHDEATMLRQQLVRLEQENQQLRQNIGRDQAFFTQGPLVFFTWVYAAGWPVAYVSPNVAQLLGHSDEDLTSGRIPYSSVVHPDDLERVASEVQAFSEAGVATFEQEYRLLHASGAIRWIYDFTTVLRDQQGAITHYYGYILDITSRKHAEETLHKQTRFSQMVIDHLPVNLFVKDAEHGRFLLWNRTAEQMFGFSATQMIGKTDADFFPPEQAAFFRQKDRETLERGAPEDIPCEPIDSPILGRRFLHTIKVPVYDQQGQPLYLIGISEDITERLRIEEDLRMRQFALDHASDGVEWLDSNGQFCYINQTTCARLGYTSDELLTMRVMDIDSNVSVERWKMLWSHIQQAGTITMESHHQHKNGTIVPVEVSATYLEFGGTPYAFAFVRDISERKKAEAQLRMFETLVENAPDPIAVADLTGTVTYGNRAFQVLFGPIGGDPPQRIVDSVAPEEHDRLHREVLPAILGQGSWRGRLRHRHLDETRFTTENTNFVVRHENGEVWAIAGVLRDISEQEQAEQERLALQQQIIAAQQAAIHELSTPLLPLADSVLALPLVGTIDSTRAQLVIETLLEGVTTHRATLVIIDITGVQVVDTQVANALILAAQAVKLLGAQVVLTGIRPEVAQTLVSLGTNLSNIISRGTLQSGIAYALAQSKSKQR